VHNGLSTEADGLLTKVQATGDDILALSKTIDGLKKIKQIILEKA
jgi:hypothetical protein